STPRPAGISGDSYLVRDLDAHNDLPPLFFPLTPRLLLKDWYPADSGSNQDWLTHFQTWAYEDPTNNRFAQPFHITYREADLVVSDLQAPATAFSGQSVHLTYTVTSNGNRDTRTAGWTDRIFLSHDGSLDNKDTELLQVPHHGTLAAGGTYSESVDVPLPDDIHGNFSLLVYADAAAFEDPAHNPSDIGFNRTGVAFQGGSPLFPWDLVSAATRELARGDVKEYQGEGNNISAAALTVTLTPPPDLQVTLLDAPLRATVGQQIDVTYRV